MNEQVSIAIGGYEDEHPVNQPQPARTYTHEELVEIMSSAAWDVIPSYGDITWKEAQSMTARNWREVVDNYLRMANATLDKLITIGAVRVKS
jgi:hypothetical protein